MTPRTRHRIALLTLGLAALAPAQVPTPIFTDDERAAVVAFWATPGRYSAGAPADADKKGIWQVRLSTAGSMWLWNLTKGKKVPPTQMATAAPAFEAWIAAKVRHDRWEALRTARAANLESMGKELPAPDANTPLEEPPLPGPMPADMQALYGPAPIFAEAVAPLAHTIAFDDLTLTYQDNTRLSSPRYAYYRFPAGVMSMGVPVKTMAPEQLDHLFRLSGVDEAQARVMRAVSILEGGFDSVNTYDTGYVSVGFIQFASLRDGAGSLGAVLKNFKTNDPLRFASDLHRFGVDVDDDGHLVVIDPTSGAEAHGADANARIIEDKRLIAVFQRAGQKSEGFRAAQIRAAKAIYWPTDETVTVTLGGVPTQVRAGDIVTSEAGLATLFDRKVNTGKIDALGDAASKLAAELGCTSAADLAKYEKPLIAAIRYRKDYLADTTLSQPPDPPAMSRARLANMASRSYRTPKGTLRGHRSTRKGKG